MTVNRTLLIVGIVLALVGAGLVFVLNLVFAPPTDFIMAARNDIPAGTRLSDLAEDAFVQVPVQFTNRTARLMLGGVAQPKDLAAMRAERGHPDPGHLQVPAADAGFGGEPGQPGRGAGHTPRVG